MMTVTSDSVPLAPRGPALVTGASSGIGRAFALRLGRAGHDLIVVGRRESRLRDLQEALPAVSVRPVVADLATGDGLDVVTDLCRTEPLSLLVNNAGLAHYGGFVETQAADLAEVLLVKTVAPTLLARAAASGMIARGGGAIVNVAGMLAFGATAPLGPAPGRATYVATLAHLVALTQALDVELGSQGLRVQALCPGLVSTEFHSRQGMDLSALPRMSAEDVVSASLVGLGRGEVICAPGVEDTSLLVALQQASAAAFAGQSPGLASRYRARSQI